MDIQMDKTPKQSVSQEFFQYIAPVVCPLPLACGSPSSTQLSINLTEYFSATMSVCVVPDGSSTCDLAKPCRVILR
jgi:hypothetical protein